MVITEDMKIVVMGEMEKVVTKSLCYNEIGLVVMDVSQRTS